MCISVTIQWNLYRGHHLDPVNVERGVPNSEVDSYIQLEKIKNFLQKW